MLYNIRTERRQPPSNRRDAARLVLSGGPSLCFRGGVRFSPRLATGVCPSNGSQCCSTAALAGRPCHFFVPHWCKAAAEQRGTTPSVQRVVASGSWRVVNGALLLLLDGMLVVRIHTIKNSGSRNHGTSFYIMEIHPSEIRIGLGQTAELSGYCCCHFVNLA